MSTLSVPLPSDMIKSIELLVKQGVVANKAEAARQAIKLYLEQKAVENVIKAAQEPNLSGDLDQLAKKL